MFLKIFMCFIWAALAVGPAYLISLYVVMLRTRSKKTDEELRRKADEGKPVNRVTAVLRHKSRSYENQYNEYQRNCLYEYTFRGKKYRYFIFSTGFDAPPAITLYFFSDRPRKAAASERELFAASRVPWFWLYLAAALTIFLNFG